MHTRDKTNTSGKPPDRPSFAPKYWGDWLALAFLFILGKLPSSISLALVRPLGWLMPRAMKSRRKIAERNVERCFPELEPDQHRVIVDECFQSLARVLVELAWAGSGSDRYIRKISRIEGQENLDEALQAGRGVLLLTAHLSSFPLAVRIILLQHSDLKPLFRPLRSPVFNWIIEWICCHYGAGSIRKRNLGRSVRYLRNNGVIWYAPDQDFGPRQSEFAPFFGIQAASLLATLRLARLTDCKVVPMFPIYDPSSRRYTVRLLPALENFPGDDPVADLALINRLTEEHIRLAPGQYWWIHRRFKTRPEGEPPFYS